MAIVKEASAVIPISICLKLGNYAYKIRKACYSQTSTIYPENHPQKRQAHRHAQQSDIGENQGWN
jgi:hypothetical protein